MVDAIKHKYQIPFGTLFLFIFVLVFSSTHFYSGPGSNGNIEQWANLTNQIFYGHQDFLFSFGPLYWLTGGATSQYSAVSYWAAVLFLSGFYAMFWAAVVWMASEARSTSYLLVTFVLFFQSLEFLGALYLWPFILVIYLDLYRPDQLSRREYFIYGALVGFAFYIRFFYGVVALASFGTYLISFAVANRNVRGIIFLSLGVVVSYVIIGLFVFHDYDSITNYILINSQLNFGNSVDMTLDVVNKPQTWVAVTISALALGVYTFIQRRKLFLTVSVLILISFKLGFSRTDHYLGYFVGSMAVLTLLPLLDRSVLGRGAVIVSVACLYYLSVSPSYPGAPVKDAFLPGIDFQVDYEDRMQEVYKNFRLSPELLDYIGDKSIDVYPYNNEYAFANKLNYRYRPNFQSYMTLTPKLDTMNQVFFESSNRPHFILWTAGFTCNSADCNPFDSFDGKFTLNEDPLTTSAIFLNYHKVAIGEGREGTPLMLLEKNESETEYSEVSVKSEKLEFGKWYDVPSAESGLLKIKPNFEISAYGRIKNLLFRGSILKIKYKLSSGEIKEYRLNILNAQSGVVVSPLLDNFSLSGLRVTKIMFETGSKHYFEPFFNAAWVVIPEVPIRTRAPYFDAVDDFPPEHQQERNIHCEGWIDSVDNRTNLAEQVFEVSDGFSVHGWLAYSTQSGELYDQIFLVITDSEGTRRFISTRKESRGDLSEVFHQEALESSGFVSTIDASILTGKSKLGLVAVKNSILYQCSQFEVDLDPIR